MNIDKVVKMVHENAKEKGWHDEERSDGEVIALMHSELSEALEEVRNEKPNIYFEGKKPEGVAVELADCVIRIMDWFGKEGISLEYTILTKHNYNKTRPYRHGNKKL